MASSKKKNVVAVKAPGTEQKAKVEMVNIFSSCYGYWRYFVKNILSEGGIVQFRFVKAPDSYNGKIAVASTEVEKAKKALAEYQKKNPDTKTMWQ